MKDLETLEITITKEDCVGKKYESPWSCPLACLIKTAIGSKDVSLAAGEVVAYDLDVQYRYNHSEWNADLFKQLLNGQISPITLVLTKLKRYENSYYRT